MSITITYYFLESIRSSSFQLSFQCSSYSNIVAHIKQLTEQTKVHLMYVDEQNITITMTNKSIPHDFFIESRNIASSTTLDIITMTSLIIWVLKSTIYTIDEDKVRTATGSYILSRLLTSDPKASINELCNALFTMLLTGNAEKSYILSNIILTYLKNSVESYAFGSEELCDAFNNYTKVFAQMISSAVWKWNIMN